MNLFNRKKKVPGFAILKRDRDFAIIVTSEYEIPFKLFCLNLSNLREAVECSHAGDSNYESAEDFPEEVNEELPFDIPVFSSTGTDFIDKNIPRSTFRKCNEYLFPTDAVIESITLKSNKGVVCISSNDPIYYRLLAPVLEMKQSFQTRLVIQNKVLGSTLIEATLKDIIAFLTSSTTLNKFQKNVVVGMILVHFKLYKGKPLLQKEEFDNKDRDTQDYKHYLNDIVKSRVKKYFKDLE